MKKEAILAQLTAVLCFYSCICVFGVIRNDDLRSLIDTPTPELVRHYGYALEVHHVVTEDGFILELHRIPGGNCSLQPVLLMHGLVASSADWVLAGPSMALALLLADDGFDVWMGNSRGNTYSNTRTDLTADDRRFWDWSFHELGYYDLPATIDHILKVTGHQQVLYVGHSQGTTAFFVLCATRPQYNSKVRHMVALAPVVYFAHSTSVLRLFAPVAEPIKILVDIFTKGASLQRDMPIAKLVSSFCSVELNGPLCEIFLALIFGFDPIGFNQTQIPSLTGHDPAGTSTKTLVHYAQVIVSGKFRFYDYGPVRNLKVYNSVAPPTYNLSRIQVPMSFIFGDNDALANPKDVLHFYSQLSNSVQLYRENLTTFMHLDFLIAKNVKGLVYDKVILVLYKNQNVGSSKSCKNTF